MSLFKRIFGSLMKDVPDESTDDSGSKYMPKVKLPVDQLFTINFSKNGGRFIYCDNIDEVYDNFQNILLENNWIGQEMAYIDLNLAKKFEQFEIEPSNSFSTSAFFLSKCEYLIGDIGGILVSSNQLKEYKLSELPDNFVIFATTSQLVETISEGMRGIKNKHQSNIPSNITTIKHFEIKEEKDFMSYGSSSKNLYLLLLEDL